MLLGKLYANEKLELCRKSENAVGLQCHRVLKFIYDSDLRQ